MGGKEEGFHRGSLNEEEKKVIKRKLLCARPGADHRKETVMNPHVDTEELKHLDDPEAGMATAEYAIGTVAATSFGGLLVWILDQPWIREQLENIFKAIFSFF